MKRVWGHIAAGVTLLTGGVLAFSACKHDDSTLFVQDVLAGQPVTAGQQCSFTNDPTQPSISSGVLDLALVNDYNPTYLIGNQSVPEVNSQQLQTETDIIMVQGAVVRIVDGTTGKQITTFTRLATATVYPSSGSVPGYAPITVTTLDSNTLANDAVLQANVSGGGTYRLVTYVTFFGVTTGGNNVQSDEFEFPVDVCSGCLISYSATDDSQFAPQPNCLLGGASGATAAPAPCMKGQDFPIDCSECQENLACHGAVPPGTVLDAGAD